MAYALGGLRLVLFLLPYACFDVISACRSLGFHTSIILNLVEGQLVVDLELFLFGK